MEVIQELDYMPYGGAARLWKSKRREILIAGPSGTGKTRAVLEKINLACYKYPRIRVLICRKTRSSMTQSVLVTLEEKVFAEADRNIMGCNRVKRSHRGSYLYSNGSEMVVGGLDNSERIMSTEYDFIGVFEATEVTEEDWELLTSRRRNWKMSYQQIIADCNPSGPNHWLKNRADSGKMDHFESRHEDNPAVRQEYLDGLDESLSGHRRERLLYGRWAAPEGMVYDDFDRRVHIADRDTFGKDGEILWKRMIVGQDYGFTNPAVLLLIGIDGDGRMHVCEEFYQTKMLETEIVEIAKEWQKKYPVETFVIDPSAAGLIAAMGNNGLTTEPANHTVYDGILELKSYFPVQQDGLPRITINPTCVNTIREFESYLWLPGKDKPKKENDHAMDALRYVSMYLAQQMPFIQVLQWEESPKRGRF